MARKKAILTIIFFLVICTLLFFIHGYPPGRNRTPPLKATLLKVGKADAIIVQSDNYTMVIDAGEEEDGEEITAFLNNQGITCVDTLIITHFDKDHVGGADTLVESVKIGRVLLPDYEGVSSEYLDFMKALNQTGLKPERLNKPVDFKMGEASVRVEPPLSYQVDSSQAENDNNFSLITTITHGENVLLFTGDMEKQRIRKWVSGETAVSCDFLKVPHHGIYNTALQDLIDTTNPGYAVICSSGKNPADERTLELLKQTNIQVLQTKDGDVTVISDGEHIELSQRLKK